MQQLEYSGRFAPSPTGSLHLGSLLAALASYCDAKKNNGQWLVRIEDLDPPREIKGASQNIIRILNKCGFQFDQKVIYQSHKCRLDAYQEALIKLKGLDAIYYCTCSRTELQQQTIDTHACRLNPLLNQNKPAQPYSVKLKVPDLDINFMDKVQGKYHKNLLTDCGDFVLKRKDGLFAYQIAVVVDDNHQAITNIVRGIDLIDSTPWQIYLNSLLNYKQPVYAHIPILVNAQGQKLSKQTFAKEIDNENPIDVLLAAYSYLNQTSFASRPKSLKHFWQHAVDNWQLNKIAKVSSFTA